MYHVRIWVYDEIFASGVAGPVDALTAANMLWVRQGHSRHHRSALFKWRVESLDGKPVRTASGQLLNVDGPINASTAAHAVVLTAPFVQNVRNFLQEKRDLLRPLLDGLHRQYARGAILGTYCNGSYLLAEAGLLNGRIATTHWASANEFARLYPQVNLRPAEVITEQDRILCGGAVTSYLNLILKIVEMLAGEELANALARLLLIDKNRISQTAYATIDAGNELHLTDQLVASAQRWMRENFSRPFRIADLASRLGTTERTLNRRFQQALGDAPLHYLQTLRMEVAKNLLEENRLSVDAVCEQVGYGDISSFRQLFKRETGLSPRDYQRRFTRFTNAATHQPIDLAKADKPNV
jgi:transcriptional regulator GlxA family with amidase domain